MEIDEELVLSPSKTQLASYTRGVVSSIARRRRSKKLGQVDGTEMEAATTSLVSRFSFRYVNCPGDLITKTSLKVQQITDLEVLTWGCQKVTSVT